MDLKELDALAFQMSPLPEGLTPPEQAYFLSVRCIYAAYCSGTLDADEAKIEKQKCIAQCLEFQLAWSIGQQSIRILKKIQSHRYFYDKNGCEVCKIIANEICGLDMEKEMKNHESKTVPAGACREAPAVMEDGA